MVRCGVGSEARESLVRLPSQLCDLRPQERSTNERMLLVATPLLLVESNCVQAIKA